MGNLLFTRAEDAQPLVEQNVSLLWNLVYNVRTYLNKTYYKNQEMNRMAWEHLTALPAGYPSFQEFEALADADNGCFKREEASSQTNFTLQPGNWSLCSLRTTTEASSQLSVRGSGQLISCWASVESFAGQSGTGCEVLGTGTVALKANHFYKVFAVGPGEGLGVGVRDLEKEQL